jgi:hypothetical protein
MWHTEALLMALVTGLYLYDSAILLFCNEAVLIAQGKTKWLAGFGSSRTTFRGKELYLPNPLRPTQASFQLAWQLEGVVLTGSQQWSETHKAFRGFSPFVWSLLVLLYLLLPIVLFARLGDLMILSVFILIYVNIFAIVVKLWLDHRKLGIPHRNCAFMALDMLICPPFAVNVIRKLSLKVLVTEDFVLAAQRLLSVADWEAVRFELLARLDSEISCEIEGSPRQAALALRRTGIDPQRNSASINASGQ